MLAANALAGADTVRLSTGRYFLEQLGIDENEGLIGDIDITDDLTISSRSTCEAACRARARRSAMRSDGHLCTDKP